MADWNTPSLTDLYTDFLAFLKARDVDLAKGLDPAKVTVTNPAADFIRWNSANSRWEIYNGTTWGALASTYAITVATANAVANNGVTNAALRDSAAVSVIGRSANSSGDPADIAAGANDRVLSRTSNALAFTQLTAGMAPANLWTYDKLQQVSAGFTVLGKSTTGAGNIAELAAGTDAVLGRTGSGNLVFAAVSFSQIAASAVASQADAEAGSATNKLMTPQRVAQALAAQSAADPSVCDFRLTLASGTPVPTADQTAKTTVYATPDGGNQIALYDGTKWNIRSSAEFSLALGTLTSGLPYDVFCYDNAGVPTLEFTAWTNGTTRATALTRQNGVLVKTGALTRRYLGTFYTTSTTTTEDSQANRYLYNYYNRVVRGQVSAFTSNRATSSASFAELNSEIRNNFVVGVAEDSIQVAVSGSYGCTGTAGASISVGFDGTTAEEFGVSGVTIGTPTQPLGGGFVKTGLAEGVHYATLLGRIASGQTLTLIGSGTAGLRTSLSVAFPR